MNSSNKSNNCKHCGQPCPTGDNFCCNGCNAAYDLVQANGLNSYYSRLNALGAENKANKPEEQPDIPLNSYILNDSKSPNIKKLNLMVDGIHCAACVWVIEQLLNKVEGVIHARLNMTSLRLSISWDGTINNAENILKPVKTLGYRLMPYNPQELENSSKQEQRHLLNCLAVSGFAASNVMLLSVAIWAGVDMGPHLRQLFHALSALVVIPAAIFSMQPFVKSAYASLINRRLNMDVPISLAIILALVLSSYEAITGAQETYFDSAITLLFFLLIGRYLDAITRGKARNISNHLSAMQVQFANIRRNEGGKVEAIPCINLRIGDIVIVPVGSRIPADGIITLGVSDIDTSFFTGESTPKVVEAGDSVVGGSLNLTTPLEIRITAVGENTVLAEMSRLTDEAVNRKNAYTKIADKAAQIYAPVVHILSAGTFIGWMIAGAGFHTASLHAIAVLIITCPCALALAVPAVQVATMSKLMKLGIIVKNPESLEKLKSLKNIGLDKTGTLTKGNLQLISKPKQTILAKATGLATHSSHPLSKAIVSAFMQKNIAPIKIDHVKEIQGQGLQGDINGKNVRLGSYNFCQVSIKPNLTKHIGANLWFVDEDGTCHKFEFSDELRPKAKETISKFIKAGVKPCIISGDIASQVRSIADKCGIDDATAQVLPAQKLMNVEKLCANGTTAFVGDGINDAPALARADVSFSFAAASEISRTTADIILQKESLDSLYKSYIISKQAHTAMVGNFAVALGYNAVAIPLAVAGIASPLVAAIFMSTSSLIVMANSLRLART